jgi:ethanolamine utilization protein EutN
MELGFGIQAVGQCAGKRLPGILTSSPQLPGAPTMFIARVKGHVTATAKDPAMRGRTLLIVEPLKVAYADGDGAGAEAGGRFEATGRAIVAMDAIGAGVGQLVLIVQGSSARMAEGCNKLPVDAVVVGLIDAAEVMGKSVL